MNAKQDTSAGVLALIAFVMILGIVYGNLRYHNVPDAAGRTYDCAIEVAGYAWGCAS